MHVLNMGEVHGENRPHSNATSAIMLLRFADVEQVYAPCCFSMCPDAPHITAAFLLKDGIIKHNFALLIC